MGAASAGFEDTPWLPANVAAMGRLVPALTPGSVPLLSNGESHA